MNRILTSLCIIFLLSIVSTAQVQTLMGTMVNSYDFDDYAPTLSRNGTIMVFQSNRADGTHWKLYETYINEDGEWEEAQAIEIINETANESDFSGGPFLTYDDQEIYFTSNRTGGQGENDIWYSERTDNGWSMPVNLGSPINTSEYEGFPSLTEDKQHLYFMRMNKENLKKTKDITYDIYVSHKDENGIWGVPEKLPAPVNTGYEGFARIMPNGNSMVISSIREGGKGGFDFYVTKTDGKGNWSEPEPMEELNSKAHEEILATTFNREMLIYSLSDETKMTKNEDLYLAPIPVVLQNVDKIKIRGLIKDNISGEPMDAVIQVYDYETNELVAEIHTDIETGEYVVLLDKGVYNIVTKPVDERFEATTQVLDIREESAYNQEFVVEDIKIEPTTVDVEFEHVLFAFAKSNIDEAYIPTMEKIATTLEEYEGIKILIEGHTDNVGSESFNMKLSKKRAMAVYDWLVKHGVNPQRLVVEPKGESEPALPNTSKQNRAKNRRVEISVIQKNEVK